MSGPITVPWRTRVAVVVGDPVPRGRTLQAATYVARELVGREPDLVVDLVDLEADLVAEVCAAELVVFGSPTDDGVHTRLLQAFLDRFPSDALAGLAVPLMTGPGPGHALAPDVALRPALSAIARIEPAKGLYIAESSCDDPAAYAWWLDLARPVISACLGSGMGISA